MHETHIIGDIFRYLEEEERTARKAIKKVYISLSEFGAISKEHFLEHFREGAKESKWQGLEIEIKKVPCGSELEITRIEFA